MDREKVAKQLEEIAKEVRKPDTPAAPSRPFVVGDLVRVTTKYGPPVGTIGVVRVVNPGYSTYPCGVEWVNWHTGHDLSDGSKTHTRHPVGNTGYWVPFDTIEHV